MAKLTFEEYCVFRQIEKDAESAIENMVKRPSGENDVSVSESLLSLSSAISDYFKTPLPLDVSEITSFFDESSLPIVKTVGGFYISRFDEKYGYTVFREKKTHVIENKEELKKLGEIASKYHTSDKLSAEEQKKLELLIQKKAITFKPFGKNEVLDMLYVAINKKESLKKYFIDLTGSKPTKKFLKEFSIDDLIDIDRKLYTGIVAPLFDDGEYVVYEDAYFKGNIVFDDIRSEVISAAGYDRYDTMNDVIKRLNELVDEGLRLRVSIPSGEEGVKLDYSSLAKKSALISELKNIKEFAKKEISGIDVSVFFDDNEKKRYLDKINVVKFSTNTSNQKFLSPSLNIDAVDEEVGITRREEKNVSLYKSYDKIEDAIVSIRGILDISSHSKKNATRKNEKSTKNVFSFIATPSGRR